MTSLILASGSAIRQTLLTACGLSVIARPVTLNEEALRTRMASEGTAIGTMALGLARAKAWAAFSQGLVPEPDAVVIAADQILECEGRVFAKPKDLDEAREHLIHLRGRTHRLHTATVLYRAGQELWTHLDTPALTMRLFSDAFLDSYLAAEGTALLACVGAYRLEGPGAQLFAQIEGSHDAVLGLPRLPLLAALRDAGAIAL